MNVCTSSQHDCLPIWEGFAGMSGLSDKRKGAFYQFCGKNGVCSCLRSNVEPVEHYSDMYNLFYFA